ncbi:hypothetical protein [Aquimarina macrocephali]|uniref:hypothetical protein n=1 Tax=Aquimarina macrocephali TaxID=666563 RepID=UPI000463E69A|nr:hypothetical protein [Aquimarina macrocephali]
MKLIIKIHTSTFSITLFNLILLVTATLLFLEILNVLSSTLLLGKEVQYEDKHNYPLGVDRVQYDEFWYGDEEYNE